MCTLNDETIDVINMNPASLEAGFFLYNKYKVVEL